MIRFTGVFKRWRLHVRRDVDVGLRVAVGPLRFAVDGQCNVCLRPYGWCKCATLKDNP